MLSLFKKPRNGAHLSATDKSASGTIRPPRCVPAWCRNYDPEKVCLLGTSGVGKTSLGALGVHSLFSDKYLTTVGVKIDKKTVTVDGTEG